MPLNRPPAEKIKGKPAVNPSDVDFLRLGRVNGRLQAWKVAPDQASAPL